METIGALDAKTRLSELLDRAFRGETFLITRHGRPAARPVPESQPDRDRVAAAVEQLKAFHKTMPRVPLQELLDARREGHRYEWRWRRLLLRPESRLR